MSATPTLCWFFHRWSRWEQYGQAGTAVYQWGKLAGQSFAYREKRQRRTCARCGKVQDEVYAVD